MSPPEDLARQRWYHVGRPWMDRPGMIYAGSEDPHAGTFVADTGDDFGVMPDDDPRAAPAVLAAIADLIVHEHNRRIASLGEHEPGDNHHYRIECEVCGERGVIRLSVDPERVEHEPPK